MIEHKCENCGYDWKTATKCAHCPACNYVDDVREEKGEE